MTQNIGSQWMYEMNEGNRESVMQKVNDSLIKGLDFSTFVIDDTYKTTN